MKFLKFAIYVGLALLLLIAIPYRFIWPVTPAWLDFVVYGGAVLALLLGLATRKDEQEGKAEGESASASDK